MFSLTGSGRYVACHRARTCQITQIFSLESRHRPYCHRPVLFAYKSTPPLTSSPQRSKKRCEKKKEEEERDFAERFERGKDGHEGSVREPGRAGGCLRQPDPAGGCLRQPDNRYGSGDRVRSRHDRCAYWDGWAGADDASGEGAPRPRPPIRQLLQLQLCKLILCSCMHSPVFYCDNFVFFSHFE